MTETTAAYDRVIAARTPWSHVVRRGEILRIIDLYGQQAVDTLLYNGHDTAERYDAQQTLLGQRRAYVGAGTELFSNDGNVLATVVADTCGLHDTIAGACSCEANTVRFGHETRYMHACRENFLLELAAYGMTKRDIVANINFFYERAGAARWRTRGRRRRLGAGQFRRYPCGDGRALRHFELSASQ